MIPQPAPCWFAAEAGGVLPAVHAEEGSLRGRDTSLHFGGLIAASSLISPRGTSRPGRSLAAGCWEEPGSADYIGDGPSAR
jgi:hypothetical protein